MSLINQVAGDCKSDQTRYIALLRRNENTSANVAELRQLMIRLNKTDEQVAIDASIIRRGDALHADVRSGLRSTLEQRTKALTAFDEATPELWKAFMAAQEEARRQWQADRAREREPIDLAHGQARTAHQKATESMAAFNQLKQQHPDLFVDQACKSHADIA
jgi:hypothetical protein